MLFMFALRLKLQEGIQSFDIVGLGDAAVKESRQKEFQSALRSSNIHFPVSRITVNLAPADEAKNRFSS